jgi:RNase P subunit RPR2
MLRAICAHCHSRDFMVKIGISSVTIVCSRCGSDRHFGLAPMSYGSHWGTQLVRRGDDPSDFDEKSPFDSP